MSTQEEEKTRASAELRSEPAAPVLPITNADAAKAADLPKKDSIPSAVYIAYVPWQKLQSLV